MELTKEYFEQHLEAARAADRAYLDTTLTAKFDEFAAMVAKGFAATASKDELQEVRRELKEDIAGVKSDLAIVKGDVQKLSDGVKEIIPKIKRQDQEFVELKIKYHELDDRVTKVEAKV